MSSTTGLLFDANRKYPSFEMLNIKCLIVGTGNQIAAIAEQDLELGNVASVTEDSTDMTLREGVLYVWTLTGWVAINAGTHFHTSSNNGGLLTKVMVKGGRNLWLRDYLNPKKFYNDSAVSKSATASYSMNANGYLELKTNVTTNNYINLYDVGLLYTFGSNLMFDARLKLSSGITNYVARFGYNSEDAEDPTLNNNPKILIEGCDACSADKVSIVSANGTNRQKDPTSITDLVTDIANYRLELDPVLAKIFYSRNNTTFVTKTNYVPNTGTPSRTRVIHCGVQTTNTSEKIMEIYGFYGYGQNGETSWNPITHSSYIGG